MTVDEQARQHHAAIRANVDDLFEKRIDHATFAKKASALHAASRRAGPEVDDAVGLLIAASLSRAGARARR